MRIMWLPCAKVLLDNDTECKRTCFIWTWHANISSGGQVNTEFIGVDHQWQAGLDNLWYLLFWMAFWRCSFNVCNKFPYFHIALNTFLRSNMTLPR